MTPASLRHSTPAVWRSRSATVYAAFACDRLIRRPAPCAHESSASFDPRPRTMYERAPMLPGMMPSSSRPARIAPLRVT